MSPYFEQILIFSVMSVLVTLFTWIYLRDRQKGIGLWMIGWIAILIHFSADLLAGLSLLNTSWKTLVKVGTLEVAGISFVLSVSAIYANTRRRIFYVLMVGLPSVIYLALMIWGPRQGWIFPALLVVSIAGIVGNSWRYYRPVSFYSYFLLAGPAVYAGWAATKAAANPMIGLIYYLSTFFIVAGLLYGRRYRRLTPGVLTASIAFLAWGSVFPVAYFLRLHNIGPPSSSVLWDLPKYFVAFGMILTLFENEAQLATTAARQYRALFEGNLAGVYVATLDGELLDCNCAFASMYGFASKQELLANSDSLFWADLSDREHFLERLRRDGQVINHECRKFRKDGSFLWSLERASIFTDAGGRKLVEGTVIDITERKQAELALKNSEERFSAIFRHSPVGCGIVSLDGVFLDANDALLKMFGLPADQVVGRTGVQFGLWKSQEDRDRFYARMRSEGCIKNMEIEFTDAMGAQRSGLYFGTLVKLGDKECIFGMQLDRTEQRDLEQRFLQAQKMEALGRLAGGVAHDFNNLMGVVGGYAELLEARVRDEQLRHYCAKVLETTQRAGALTSKLLTFSRKEITRPAPLKVDCAIRELASILSRLIGEDIELELDLRAKSIIVIDKTHFEQILFNVVVNARDAMPQGGQLRIQTLDAIGSSEAAGGRRSVAIRITDTGVGMDEGTRLRAFEPFFTTKDMGRGTGLGLSTVYGIVQQCGGEIQLESEPGHGTCITILLPALEEVEIPEQPEKPVENVRGSGHILLVEDEAELRNTNAEFLMLSGYSVTSAASGPEALELARQAGHIDLVISDVVMPKMNGREFADRLLAIYPDVKVLFVSGYADDVVLQNGISKLGTPFLQKPFSLRVLSAKVHEVLTAETRETSNL